jgi:cytochrome c oxidase subunit 3
MMTPLVVVVAIMAVAVIWLLRQTMHVRPWVEERAAESAPGGALAGGASFPASPATVGLGVFLAVATSLFVLTICAYFMRMMAADWRTVVFPSVLWVNTGLLIVSDLAMRSARAASRRGEMDRVRTGLIAAGLCSFAFLAGQIWAWQQLNASGYFGSPDAGGALAASPANSFFYLFTALHGVHVLGGLWFWGRTTARVWRGAEAARVRLSVELCTVYWHYLLLVWLVLLALLVPAISELCRGNLSF